MEKCKFTEADRRAAVMAYLVTGSQKAAVDASGSTRFTIARWMKEPWWHDLTAQLHDEYAARIDAAYTQIIENALAEISDRLDNGDASTRWNDERGEFERRLVSAKDAAIIMGICYDKRALLREQAPTEPEHAVNAIANKLAEIGRASLERNKA